MLLEEWSQRSPYPIWNDNKFECESLSVALPELADIELPVSPLWGPTSPRDWFGNEATYKAWHQSYNNIFKPSTSTTFAPSSPSWVYQSSGLDSGRESGNAHYSKIAKIRFPGPQKHQTSTPEMLECLSVDGVLTTNAEYGTSTNLQRTKNIHPNGRYWTVDVSCESDNVTCDTHERKARELKHPTSAYNKTHGRAGQYHSGGFVYRPEELGEELNGKWTKIDRSQRKRCLPRIREKTLKAFARSIGYRNFGPDWTNEILNYIIHSKLVCGSCKQLQGAKFLQYQIINSNWADRADILEQLMENLSSICSNKYGNHVVQCYFQLNNPSVEREILLRLRGNLCNLAMGEYSSRVLQKAILSVNDNSFRILTDVIAPMAYMLARDHFGHHVLQRAIERGSGAMVQVILVNIIGRRRKTRLIELSRDVFGCRIIERMLENAHIKERNVILHAIMGSNRDLLALCQDPYGNYVVQHILNQFGGQHSMRVMDALDGKLSRMAKHKFCSNVLEMLYKQGGREVEDRLIKLVNRRLLKDFLSDQFANYLVQTMLREGEPENKQKIRLLLMTIPNLQKFRYGKIVNNML